MVDPEVVVMIIVVDDDWLFQRDRPVPRIHNHIVPFHSDAAQVHCLSTKQQRTN